MGKPVITPAVQAAFDKAVETQNVFWEALSELEAATDITDINSYQDFSDMTPEDLFDEEDGDLCDTCMESGKEITRTDGDGKTVCTECDASLPEQESDEEEVVQAHEEATQ